MARFWSKVKRTSDGCWEWQAGPYNDGYGLFWYERKSVGAHCMSWFLAHGRWANKGYQINHRCNNKRCVRPNHLYEGTESQNTIDSIVCGSFKPPSGKGEKNGRSKLTAKNVKEIRSLYSTGTIRKKVLATMFNVSRSCIVGVTCGYTWKEEEQSCSLCA